MSEDGFSDAEPAFKRQKQDRIVIKEEEQGQDQVQEKEKEQLLTLPVELLEKISSYLSTDDLCAFRLSCKAICNSLYPYIASEFFTKRQFMITVGSLSALLSISTHEYFAKYLKHVIFGLESVGHGEHAQLFLIDRGDAQSILTATFKNLPNLSIIGFRDFYSRGRDRDGPNQVWKSYGHSFHPTHFSNSNDFYGDIFNVVVSAINKSQVKPTEIQIILRNQFVGIPDKAFKALNGPAMKPQLENLQVLLLNLEDSEECENLFNFLSQTKNLCHIRFNYRGERDSPDNLLEQFSRTLNEPSPIILNHLKRLDFGTASITPQILLKSILKFSSTLEVISFWKVSLLGSDLAGPGFPSRSYYDSLRAEQIPNEWANLFKQILDIPGLKLKQLLVGWVKQNNNGMRFFVDFDFEYVGEEKGLGNRVKKYCGSMMDEFLNKLSSRDNVHVRWYPRSTTHVTPINHSDSDNDEDNSDESEDSEGEDSDF